jgi:hypothetical protein
MSERGEAKRISAKLHKNSGRGKISKGDARWYNFCIDFKEYPKGMRIDQNVWAKVTTDAMKSGLDPALILVMGSESKKTRLAIIELSILEQLMQERQNNEDSND